MKDKKGLAQSQLVSLIAGLMLAIMLLITGRPFISIAHAESSIETCKTSVSLATWALKSDLWVMDWTWLDSPFKFDCHTIFSEITENSIKRSDDKIKLSKTPDERNEQLKEFVMQSMRECWYMYGEGKVNVQQKVETEGTACIVCSEIIPSKEVKEKAAKDKKHITLDDMYSFAAATNLPMQSDKTYLDYFLQGAPKPKATPAEIDQKKQAVEKNEIFLDQQYSIVFAITAEGLLEGNRYKIDPGTGIVDCYISGGSTGPLKDGFARDIGCNEDGTAPSRLIFGKVMGGGTKEELESIKNTIPIVGQSIEGWKSTYPATVRLVPTKDLANNCKRMY